MTIRVAYVFGLAIKLPSSAPLRFTTMLGAQQGVWGHYFVPPFSLKTASSVRKIVSTVL